MLNVIDGAWRTTETKLIWAVVCVCFNINCAHKQMCVYKCHSCRQLYLPASGASWRLVSQIRGDLLEPTASKAEEVGWKSTNSSLPWPGRRVSSGLPGCCSSGSHKCHSFTCIHTNTQRRRRGWNIKTVGGRVSCLNPAETFYSFEDVLD